MQPNTEMSSGRILARAKETAAYLGIAKIGNEEIEKLLLELTAECEFWRQKAIEATARADFYQECDDGGCWWNPDGNSREQKEYRKQAERELEEMR